MVRCSGPVLRWTHLQSPFTLGLCAHPALFVTNTGSVGGGEEGVRCVVCLLNTMWALLYSWFFDALSNLLFFILYRSPRVS